jgi:hypothetical protein
LPPSRTPGSPADHPPKERANPRDAHPKRCSLAPAHRSRPDVSTPVVLRAALVSSTALRRVIPVKARDDADRIHDELLGLADLRSPPPAQAALRRTSRGWLHLTLFLPLPGSPVLTTAMAGTGSARRRVLVSSRAREGRSPAIASRPPRQGDVLHTSRGRPDVRPAVLVARCVNESLSRDRWRQFRRYSERSSISSDVPSRYPPVSSS